MKTLSIDANNVNITPNGIRNIILDVELENEELDSLITDLDTAKKVMALYDALDDLDDVQEVYANFDIADDILAQLD